MREIRDWALLFSAFLLCGLIIGCATPLADPTGPNSSLVVGRVVINNQDPGILGNLPLGRIESGIEVVIESEDGEQFFKATTGPRGYFMVPNIPLKNYYLNKIILRGEGGSGEYDEKHITPRRFFFTPEAGKILDVGTYSLEIPEHKRLTAKRLSPSPEAAKSHLSGKYASTPWLAREFVGGFTATTEIKSAQPGEVPRLSASEHLSLGNAYKRQKRYGPAITEYKKALKVNPNYHFAYNNLGNAYRRMGRYNDAVEAYQRALEINPNYALVHANLGRVYRSMGRYEDSKAELDKAIKLNPNRAYFHNHLCSTLRKMGKVVEAIEACKKAIAVDPSYKWAYRRLGLLYKETGRLDDAISALRKALEIDPNYSSAHALLAEVYGRQGKTDEEKEHSKKVIEELKK